MFSYYKGRGSQRALVSPPWSLLGCFNHLRNIEPASCLQYTNALLSFGFWHFHLHILLASSVLCIALSHIETWCLLRQYIQLPRRTSSCSPTHKLIIFLKTATIPTYHGISIAVPRYIAMQHPSLHYMTWCHSSLPYSLLDHWVSVLRGLPHVLHFFHTTLDHAYLILYIMY